MQHVHTNINVSGILYIYSKLRKAHTMYTVPIAPHCTILFVGHKLRLFIGVEIVCLCVCLSVRVCVSVCLSVRARLSETSRCISVSTLHVVQYGFGIVYSTSTILVLARI